MIDVPFKGSWWVRPDELLAGCYPLRYDGNVERFLGLAEAQVDAVINLMEFNERSTTNVLCEPYAHLMARMIGDSLLYHQIPIVDLCIPTREEMVYILDLIDRLLADKHKIYLHCRGGHGRTGTVVGCWLRRQGLDAERALATIQALREGAGIFSPAPQGIAQINFVTEWTEVKK